MKLHDGPKNNLQVGDLVMLIRDRRAERYVRKNPSMPPLTYSGKPTRIIAIEWPFIITDTPMDERSCFDVRCHLLKKVSEDYGRAYYVYEPKPEGKIVEMEDPSADDGPPPPRCPDCGKILVLVHTPAGKGLLCLRCNGPEPTKAS